MAAFHQLRHLPEEEGEQQSPDVTAVHVGVSHDDDLVIAQLVGVEFLRADAGAEGGDDGADFLAGQHLVEAGPLHIQDLASERQDGLGLPVPRLFGGTAGAVTLNQEDFAERRIALLAVGQLARQVGDIERPLAAGQLTRLAGSFAGRGGFVCLGNDLLAVLRMLLEPLLQTLAKDRLDHRPDLGGDQLVLGLGGEFRIRNLHGQHAGQTLAGIVAAELGLFLLRDPAFLRIGIDGPGHGAAETG